jgi:hypothetical protein
MTYGVHRKRRPGPEATGTAPTADMPGQTGRRWGQIAYESTKTSPGFLAV